MQAKWIKLDISPSWHSQFCKLFIMTSHCTVFIYWITTVINPSIKPASPTIQVGQCHESSEAMQLEESQKYLVRHFI